MRTEGREDTPASEIMDYPPPVVGSAPNRRLPPGKRCSMARRPLVNATVTSADLSRPIASWPSL
jgi:hypothetical protein